VKVWGLVPAKGFDRGKSRLRPALSDEARAAFARAVFDHVLGAALESGVLEGILVATDSPLVAEAARAHGPPIRVRSDDPGATTLAEVVDAGLHALAALGAEAALVLMADLPRLTPADVREVVLALADPAPCDVALVRAEDGAHTNALALRAPARLRTAFGRPESFAMHVEAARAAGLRVAIVENPNIAFDVDGPEDHARI